VLQCIALTGLSCSVTCTMRDSISVVTVAGRPVRGASLRSASMPPSRKRWRHSATWRRSRPASTAMSLFCRPRRPAGPRPLSAEAEPALAGPWPTLEAPAPCARPVQSSWQPASLQPPERLEYAGSDKFYYFTRTALAGLARGWGPLRLQGARLSALRLCGLPFLVSSRAAGAFALRVEAPIGVSSTWW
jgi:hypothetical protein